MGLDPDYKKNVMDPDSNLSLIKNLSGLRRKYDGRLASPASEAEDNFIKIKLMER